MSNAITLERDMRGLWLKGVRPYGEAIGAVCALILIVWQAPWLSARFADSSNPWSASGLYSGVFSWASIQSGFLFAIYAFVMPRTEPFIKAVSSTFHFKKFKSYMLRTTYLTLFVALISLVLMVWNPVPVADGGTGAALLGWVVLSVYSFLCFLKCIRTFRKLDRGAS